VMDVMTLRQDREWNLRHRVPHQGTFNANPVTAPIPSAATRRASPERRSALVANCQIA